MDSSYIVIKALYTGLITGILIAIPMGPAGVESVRWTITKNLKMGVLVAAGSLIADAGDLILINLGLLNLIETNKIVEAMFWILSGIVILYIGFKAVRDHKWEKQNEGRAVDKKRSKSSPVFTGFIVNFSNPMTHFFWLTLSTTIIRRWHIEGNFVYYTYMLALLSGMFTSLFAINYLASRGKKISTPKVSGGLSKILGYIILAFGAGFFINGVYKLVLAV